MASYCVNGAGVDKASELIDANQLDRMRDPDAPP